MSASIADLARRYEPFSTQRWQSEGPAIATLGLRADSGTPRRVFIVRTGRADQKSMHTGLPPEPVIVFVKALGREIREATAWARRYLADAAFIWQFDTADGLRYATHFDAAAPVKDAEVHELRLSLEGDRILAAADGGSPRVVSEHGDGGIFGDGAFEVSEDLTRFLRNWIQGADRRSQAK